MPLGKVKYINVEKEFGIIENYDGQNNLFFFWDIITKGQKKVEINDRVEYEIIFTPKGYIASNIIKK